MRADIDGNFASGQHTCAAVVQGHFNRSWSDKPAAAHDEFGTAGLIGVEVEGDLPVDHVLLAAPNLRHIDRNCAGRCAELSGVAGEMRNTCAPDLVLAGQASDGRTGATDPTALDDHDALPRSGQMPGESLAALSAAKDQDIIMFWLGHAFLLSRVPPSGRPRFDATTAKPPTCATSCLITFAPASACDS